jgi:hypothetical protein
MDPDYKTHLCKNLGPFTPWDLVILYGTKPLAEVHLKPSPIFLNVFKLLISCYAQQEIKVIK